LGVTKWEFYWIGNQIFSESKYPFTPVSSEQLLLREMIPKKLQKHRVLHPHLFAYFVYVRSIYGTLEGKTICTASYPLKFSVLL
jgi:hypothetical protein